MSEGKTLATDAINIGLGQYLTADGQLLPITTWIDEDCDEAVCCVAGIEGYWVPIRISDFLPEAMQ